MVRHHKGSQNTMKSAVTAWISILALVVLAGPAAVLAVASTDAESVEELTTDSSDNAHNTIAQLAQDSPKFTLLADALDITDLYDVANDPSQTLTVFAPVDTAFQALGQDSLDYLLAYPDILRLVLLYHIIGETITSSELKNIHRVDTMLEQTFKVARKNRNIMFRGNANTRKNRPKLIDTDLFASNGVVHVLDSVILPTLPIAATAVLKGISLLTRALQVTGLDKDLNNITEPLATYTFFAPTQGAFDSLDEGVLSILLGDRNLLKQVLLTHVVADKVLDRLSVLDAVSEGPMTLTALSGVDIAVFSEHRRRISLEGPGNQSPATLVNRELEALNGVIHCVSKVILPFPIMVPVPTLSATIAELAESNLDLSLLVTTLNISDLYDVANDPSQSLTVFAPVDTAFQALGQDSLDYLFANPDILRLVLLYHIVGERLTSNELKKTSLVDTMLEQTFRVIPNNRNIMFRGNANTLRNPPTVIDADLHASNGLVHVLDFVIIPTLPIAATAALNGFSLLTRVLQVTGLDKDFNDIAGPHTTYTFFAPTQGAFDRLDEGVLRILLGDRSLLRQVLLTHVVADKLDRMAIIDAVSEGPMTLTTLSGVDITVFSRLPGQISVERTGNDSPAIVMTRELDALNGVIHGVSNVILPFPIMDPFPTLSATIAESNHDLSFLVVALNITDLYDVTNDPSQNLTVFAPVDTAFQALGQDNLDYLLANPDILRLVLLYHIVGERMTLNELKNIHLVDTMLDQTFRVIRKNGNIMLRGNDNTRKNRPKVIDTDLVASNGDVHVLDSVILPTLPIAATAALNGFSLLTKALQVTGLDKDLNDIAEPHATYTFFAPTQGAFDLLDEGVLSILLGDRNLLRQVLLTHVVADKALDRMAVIGAVSEGPMTLPTLSGVDITIFSGHRRRISLEGPGNQSPATVVTRELEALNGVIHGVNKVILPFSINVVHDAGTL